MTTSALVTGAAGFVGQWLCRALLADGVAVHGLDLARPAGGILTADERAAVTWHTGDLAAPHVARAALDAAAPAAVYHLAGLAFPPDAAHDPAAAVQANVVGAARLLDAVARTRGAGDPGPAVVVVGSAEQYGAHDAAELPLREEAEQRPLTPYAASKAAQEVVALAAWRRDGVRVVAARPFNHSGPGQPARYLVPGLVARALAARGGGAIAVGNRDVVRDVSHVADVVAAYRVLAARGAPGTCYNVCSGRGWTVADLAALVAARVGVTAPLVADPALARAVDVPALVGDPSRLRALGWAPAHDVPRLVDDLIDAASH